MKAIKDNREYTIEEAEVRSFANEGYDIYDDSGKLVEYGAGKTVAYTAYAKLNELYEAALAELAELKSKKRTTRGAKNE